MLLLIIDAEEVHSFTDAAQYFVLEGEGKFFVEDKEFNVKKGDLIFIPKNTKYKDSGHLTLLAVSSPRFDRYKRERFDIHKSYHTQCC